MSIVFFKENRSENFIVTNKNDKIEKENITLTEKNIVLKYTINKPLFDKKNSPLIQVFMYNKKFKTNRSLSHNNEKNNKSN